MSRSSKIVKMAIKKANIDGNIISDESDEEPAENPWKAFNQWKYGCEDIVPTPEKNDYEDTISELDNSSESWKKPSDATTDTGSDIISYIDDDLTEDINYESKNKDGEKKTYAVMSQLNPYSYTDEPVDSHENNEITNTDIPSSVHVSASKSTGSIENPINSDENDETSNTCRPSSVHASVSESTALIQKAVGCIGGSDKKIIVEGSKRKIRMWDKRDRCLYCNEDVTNFSRHLFRKHKTEQTVIMIMDLPKGDKTRATMINSMRKNGNFNAIEKSEIIRPIQRLNLKTSELPNISEFMPCPYCKGIYRKASLNKHAKKCLQNENKESKDKVNTQSLGQNLLAFNASKTNFINKSRIKNEVYSRMHADNIALIGKSDPVISQYGDDYLKKHKRPHIRNAVSNKVREMGRLLLQLRKIYNIQTMIQALNTKHYDKVVHAAHIISGYDPEQKIFKAPSLAMHMRTNLLYVCSACKTLLLKKDPVLPVLNHAEELKKVKAFRNLVQERWKFDMGSLAQKDLVEKHSEKSSNIPITSDVIKFQSHVLELCETNYKDLKKDPKDKTAYKNLNEATLVYTMMHNRKRSGDAQYTRLDSYTKTVMERSQEEFMSNLTEAEKLLNSQYKRITTLGEGSKRVAILFPKRIQTYMELLISIRGNFVKPMNPYLFADTNSVEWINGPYLMSKFAKSCCASHPETLTSTRLRKQIATVLQALNLSPTEKEQLASFMGHTEKTHNEYYRLPQSLYQTAKVSKLLLLMEQGGSAQYAGKSLDEIDFELYNEKNASNSDEDSDEDSNDENAPSPSIQNKKSSKASKCQSSNKNNLGSDEEHQPSKQTKRNAKSKSCSKNSNDSDSDSDYEVPKRNKKGGKEEQSKVSSNPCRGSWNAVQKEEMKKCFKRHIKCKISPKKDECLTLKNQRSDLFGDKTWVQIKIFVYNTYTQIKKK